jgi:exonuclease SbcC
MSDEERAALEAELSEIETRRAALANDRAGAHETLRRHDAVSQARTRLAQAVAARDRALRSLEQLAPQQATLDHVARAEPIRGARDALRRAKTALDGAQNEAAASRETAQTADKALQSALEKMRSAEDALVSIENEIERMAEVWAQAEDLDARIRATAGETEKLRDHAAIAARDAQSKRAEHSAALARRTEVLRVVGEARAELSRLEIGLPLFERWAEIDESLAKREELSVAREQKGKRLREAESDLERGARQREALDADDENDRAALRSLLAQIEERAAAHAALDEAAAQARAEELRNEADTAQTLMRLARDYETARQRRSEAETDAEGFATKVAELERRLRSLGEARILQSARAAEAARLGELADAAADPQSLRLRAALEEGEPCPVCGGREHPFAHAQDAARELIERLQAARDAERRRLRETDDAIVAARAEYAEARAKVEDACRRRDEAQADVSRLTQEFEALRKRRGTIGGETFAEIGSASPQLCALDERLTAERNAIRDKLDAARRLRGELDRLRRLRDQKSAAIEARRAEREQASGAFERASETRTRLKTEIIGLTARIESIDRSLSAFLRLCDLSGADLDRDADGARRRLQHAGAQSEAARRRLSDLEAELAALELRIAALEAAAASQTKNENDAASALEARGRELQSLQKQRAQLLGGEATAAHRRRHEDMRSAAAAAREAARNLLGDARIAAANAATRESLANGRFASAGVEHAAAQELFRRALAETGFDEPAAMALLDIDAAQLAKMRETVDAAARDLADANAAIAARQTDLDDAAATGPLDESRDAVAAREAALTQELDALAGRLGELRAIIHQDEKLESRARALSTEIGDARASSKLWDEIDAAIGSAAGDKFRRFAQSVTLEHLVALANHRLAFLAPRYRLERAGGPGSLGLQIIDRDLGDERRSTRSLSGGERFLVSLALALALAGLEGRDSFIDTLFIDEGFGALDAATLDVAIDALETLQGQGRKVGVISHVESLQNRIATKVCVERRGGGVSVVRVVTPGGFGQ